WYVYATAAVTAAQSPVNVGAPSPVGAPVAHSAYPDAPSRAIPTALIDSAVAVRLRLAIAGAVPSAPAATTSRMVNGPHDCRAVIAAPTNTTPATPSSRAPRPSMTACT